MRCCACRVVALRCGTRESYRELWDAVSLLFGPSTFCPLHPWLPVQQDAGNKKPPFRAPFTPCVPEIMRVVRGYIVDSGGWVGGWVWAGGHADGWVGG